jgi:hypothetical protein
VAAVLREAHSRWVPSIPHSGEAGLLMKQLRRMGLRGGIRFALPATSTEVVLGRNKLKRKCAGDRGVPRLATVQPKVIGGRGHPARIGLYYSQ